MKMKALSLKQPWASWVASGRKTIETRTWKTNYRGPILICSSQAFDSRYTEGQENTSQYVTGAALCVVNLVDVRPYTKADQAQGIIPFNEGERRYAWVLNGVRLVDRFPVKGMLGLFEVDVPEAMLVG